MMFWMRKKTIDEKDWSNVISDIAYDIAGPDWLYHNEETPAMEWTYFYSVRGGTRLVKVQIRISQEPMVKE